MKVDPLLGVSWLQLSEASMTESVYGIHAPVRRHGTSVVESKGGTNQSNAHNIKKKILTIMSKQKCFCVNGLIMYPDLK